MSCSHRRSQPSLLKVTLRTCVARVHAQHVSTMARCTGARHIETHRVSFVAPGAVRHVNSDRFRLLQDQQREVKSRKAQIHAPPMDRGHRTGRTWLRGLPSTQGSERPGTRSTVSSTSSLPAGSVHLSQRQPNPAALSRCVSGTHCMCHVPPHPAQTA